MTASAEPPVLVEQAHLRLLLAQVQSAVRTTRGLLVELTTDLGRFERAADRFERSLNAADADSATGEQVPTRLSVREIEVLRLVATGNTNREIARHLLLSERTVPVHVRNILTKTNCPNRAAAAVFALRHGLA